MIPRTYIIEWASVVPWAEPRQIEQDLIITKALLHIYEHPILKETLAFRGGTALNKLIFKQPSRYSEDIDLVQINTEPIGATIDLLQEVLNPWLGSPKRDASHGIVTLSYRVISDDEFPIKLKVEINTREHFSILGFQKVPFSSSSTWYSGQVKILTYKIEELLGTKLRALYQRRKGRDLYDLYMILTDFPHVNSNEIIHCFTKYMQHANQSVSQEDFLANIEKKLKNKEFLLDIQPLLPQRSKSFDPKDAYEHVKLKLLKKL